MKNRIRITTCTLAGIAMFAVGCGEDDPSPLAPVRRESKLAIYTGNFTGTNAVEPTQPYVAAIEFGVFDEPATSLDPPDVVLFSTREFADGDRFEARPFNTGGFGEIVERLTDNVDRSVFIRAAAGPTVQSTLALESIVFTYTDPMRPGPDLAGAEITGILVNVDLNVTENAGMWSTSLTYSITVLGH